MSYSPSMSAPARSRIESFVKRTQFGVVDEAFFATEDGRFLLDQHVWLRYEQARQNLAPWAQRTAGLSGRRLVEIGSGSASSTAAFAQYARSVEGFEINQASVDLAAERLSALEIYNAKVSCVPGEDLLAAVSECGRDADGFLFYAVLEHMTIAERLNALTTTWQLLRPGGLMIVIETPNRLTYTDLHTSHLPFFHMLPLSLAARYFERSPRDLFVHSVRSSTDRDMMIQRWGTGVSYHEFEVAVGDTCADNMVADGFEEEITSLYPIQMEDELLASFFERKGLRKHRAFTRNHLNFILRKPG